ncbi:TetR/AcrR family transcriptional regulator C-terminal domain-containing protein [Nonomuraea mangrovi]|uniref:TetR/AcrR family transcriptional regulator C-terminal domain-containing protein n=1 Tax=Nonomuraea mangrovi TaxID=2316207 RepID=A0ABW4TDB5_9ACTN
MNVWSRPEAPRRPALSREAIVAAAIAIADVEGLAAVSIRRVAAELGARAMSLYTYIERKEDLFDLMADQVSAEVLVDEPLPAGWREALLAIARKELEAVTRHPWRVDLVAQRVNVGPNGLRHLEQSLAALDGLEIDRTVALRILAAVDDYVLGHIVRTSPRMGVAGGDRQPHLPDLLATGEFPRLSEAMKAEPDAAGFEQGLGWLLDGIETGLGAR